MEERTCAGPSMTDGDVLATMSCRGTKEHRAVALGKKIRVISLDHSPLPAYLAHLQASNVPQLMMRKPWLTFDDAILAAILDAIGLGS